MNKVMIATALVAWSTSCTSPQRAGQDSTRPYSAAPEAERDTVRATELSNQAAELLLSDPRRAKQLLREALTADLFFGPAHNNLGVLYLKEGKLYEAAQEFEWARKLLPGHPDPRVNLALTLERAGQVDEALTAYSAAIELYPGYLPAIQGLACRLVQEDREDERLRAWLERIALESESAEWRDWARLRLAND